MHPTKLRTITGRRCKFAYDAFSGYLTGGFKCRSHFGTTSCWIRLTGRYDRSDGTHVFTRNDSGLDLSACCRLDKLVGTTTLGSSKAKELAAPTIALVA